METTTHMTRPHYWRELTNLGELIPTGCPIRMEFADGTFAEYTYGEATPPEPTDYLTAVFVDTRWTP